MLPKFSRQHWVWIVALIIALLYLFAPDSGVTHIIHQIFHTVLSFLLSILG